MPPAMSDTLTLTLYPHNIVWNDPSANRRHVEEVMSRMEATDLFVVPETFTTGFGEQMAAYCEEPDGATLAWARRLAAQHQCLFVASWIVRDGNATYNRLHWVLPDGSYGSYDKAHTFRPSGEHNVISCGRRRTTFTYRGWRIRPAVCYDLRFPQWLRNAAAPDRDGLMDYDLLLVCANWPASRREAWNTLLRARAIENLCYVAGCNRTGTDGYGGHYSGDCAIVDYKGQPVVEGGAETVCLRQTLEREPLVRFRQKWPFYLDFD